MHIAYYTVFMIKKKCDEKQKTMFFEIKIKKKKLAAFFFKKKTKNPVCSCAY